jgi:CHASE2 domain-containing sensor protein
VKRIRPHLFVVCSLVAILLTGVPTALTNSLLGLRFSTFPRQASGEVVVVAIDSPSIEAIGVWPWPRELHAKLINKLSLAGTTGIAFDVDFSSHLIQNRIARLPMRFGAPADRSSFHRSSSR